MHIIIYRNSVFEIQETFGYFVTELLKHINSDDIKLPQGSGRIVVGDILIDFYCNGIHKMGGVRPNYYNTDSCLASDFLECGATKVNGKEIKDISEIINIIGGVNGSSRSNKI